MSAVRKIVVIGPESTGKSTLSAALAEELDTVWVPEYAREYLSTLGRIYRETDLLEMAKGQIAAEDQLFEAANKYLICDTDLHVIKVWSEAKYGYCDKGIMEMIAARVYDLYLLTDIDVPWTDDPLREHPLASERQYFYHQYRDLVQQSGVPWVNIHGNEAERLSKAIQAIRSLGNVD